jgi:uncharacterized glyoxalase superfamily protein PhnB
MTESSKPEGAPDRGQPETFRARAVSISLTVKDVNASLAWYEGVMGFTVDNKREAEGKLRSVSLKAGEVRLLINQDNGAKGWDRIKGQGFSMMFTTVQNVDELAAGIKARGGTLGTEPADMPWGPRAFRMVDPDGYHFTIASEWRT